MLPLIINALNIDVKATKISQWNSILKSLTVFGNMIDKPKKSSEWKIHLTTKVNFMSSNDNDNKQLMHSKSDNIEIMIDNEIVEIIEKLFELLLTRYQLDPEESMKSSDFV